MMLSLCFLSPCHRHCDMAMNASDIRRFICWCSFLATNTNDDELRALIYILWAYLVQFVVPIYLVLSYLLFVSLCNQRMHIFIKLVFKGICCKTQICFFSVWQYIGTRNKISYPWDHDGLCIFTVYAVKEIGKVIAFYVYLHWEADPIFCAIESLIRNSGVSN